MTHHAILRSYRHALPLQPTTRREGGGREVRFRQEGRKRGFLFAPFAFLALFFPLSAPGLCLDFVQIQAA